MLLLLLLQDKLLYANALQFLGLDEAKFNCLPLPLPSGSGEGEEEEEEDLMPPANKQQRLDC